MSLCVFLWFLWWIHCLKGWCCLPKTAGLPLEVTADFLGSQPDAECYLIQLLLSRSSLHPLVDLVLFSANHLDVFWICQLNSFLFSDFWSIQGCNWRDVVLFLMGNCKFVSFQLLWVVYHLHNLVSSGILFFCLFSYHLLLVLVHFLWTLTIVANHILSYTFLSSFQDCTYLVSLVFHDS